MDPKKIKIKKRNKTMIHLMITDFAKQKNIYINVKIPKVIKRKHYNKRLYFNFID